MPSVRMVLRLPTGGMRWRSFAVLALAMAIERLPGQASPMLITEHNFPWRSTTADHIRFGEKMPPLFRWTTAVSCACKWLTVAAGMAQVSA